MTERSPIEIVQALARQRLRKEQNPLLLTRAFPASDGERISHLPISQRLAQAWVTLTGAPFRLHQSLALSSLRRGEPFVLMGGGAAARQTTYLLLHELLHGETQSRVLLLLPDDGTADLYLREFTRLNNALGQTLSLAQVEGTTSRTAPAARVVLATPHTLHERLLRHHDRAWQSFWANLRMVVLAEVDYYSGVAIEHLAALILRSARLTPPDKPLALAATISEVLNADMVLTGISGQPWRIIPVNDIPQLQTVLALWQTDAERLHETVTLALACQREGYTVHITCARIEIPLVQQLIGPGTDAVRVSDTPQTAQVQLIAGYANARPALRRALAAEAQLVLMLLGTTPAERTLARLSRGQDESVPLLDTPPTWVLPAANAYVSVQHLLCAATERPLSFDEVHAWQSHEIIDRLEDQQQLVRLPEDKVLWQPLAATGDPYEGFGLRAAGIPTTYLTDEQRTLLDTFDPSAFDRWGFHGALLPPGRSSFRVIERNDETGTLTLQAEYKVRQTFPLRHCTVRVRDERDQRMHQGRTLGWGRVLIEEEIYGYREARPDNAAAERVLTEPLTTRWAAPALWIDLPVSLQIDGQLVGWSLVAALTLRVICAYTDIVPAYDADLRRIYLADTQPGGNGLAIWLYDHLETLLPLAYDIALDCRSDTLLEPVARADMDWLLTLLSGEMALPEEQKQTVTASPSLPVSGAVSRANPTREAPPQQYRKPPVPPTNAQSDTTQQPLPPESEAVPIRRPPPTPANERRPSGRQRPPNGRTNRAAPARRRREDAPHLRKDDPTRAHQHAEREAPSSSPARERMPAPPAAEPPPPDPQAMIARMRRLREQREAAARAAQPSPQPTQPSAPTFPTEPRFRVGDRVFCLPYGYGEVRASHIENGKEILRVAFPDFGELTVEPSVSVIRHVEPSANDELGDGS